ncbi:MAG: hypothetical protein AAGI34_05030 [Pseudomonadota bacterium]
MRILSLAAVLGVLIQPVGAQIVAPPTVDPGEAVAVALETPARAGLVLRVRPIGQEGLGTVIASHAVFEGAAQVALIAPARPGSYALELVAGERVLSRAALEVAAVALTLTAPAEVGPAQPFKVGVSGQRAPEDRIEIVRGSAVVVSVNVGEAASITLDAPDTLGRYALRYVDGASGAAMAETVLTVTAARAWLGASSVVSPGQTLRIEWYGPAGANHAIQIQRADGATVVERSLAGGTTRRGALSLDAPRTRGRYRLRYLDVRTGDVLSDQPLIVR